MDELQAAKVGQLFLDPSLYHLQSVFGLYYSLRFLFIDLSRRESFWFFYLPLISIQTTEAEQSRHAAWEKDLLTYIMHDCLYCSKISAALLRQPRELKLYGDLEEGGLGSWEEYTQQTSCPECKFIVRCLEGSRIAVRQFAPDCRLRICLSAFGYWITNVCCL